MALQFAVVDVETTGIDARCDRVVEVACVVVDRAGRRLAEFGSLVDPGIPIHPAARAVHGISDDDVRGAPRLAALQPLLAALTAGAVVVAHNAAFDRGFLPFLAARPWLCTLRFAKHMFPEAPRFANQALREYLRIEEPRLAGRRPHRALADALVTSHILAACMRRAEAAGLADDPVALAAAPIRLRALRFGRHRGQPIAALPADYLEWILARGAGFSRDVVHSV
jgi:exodeoxyribonuclease X